MAQILQLTGQLSFVVYQPELEEKTVNANGTYLPAEGKDGFSKVVVNVPSEEPILTELTITTSNADYDITPVAPAVGFSKVDVFTEGVLQIDKSEIDQLEPGASLQYIGLYTGIVITNNS